MIKSKLTAIVFAAYAFGSYEKGDVISRHSSYDLAEKAARRHPMSSFLAVKYV